MVVESCRYFVFFQAEDGIRDLVRSRGLGDVYKRQVHFDKFRGYSAGTFELVASPWGDMKTLVWQVSGPVSYTHLTLPTSDLV